MTVKGDDSQKVAVTRKESEEQEQVPSYQEAVAGTSSDLSQSAAPTTTTSSVKGKNSQTIPATSAAGPQSGPTNLYPFPSVANQTHPDGTIQIAIVQGDGLLPLHATAIRRGPRAGRRFLAAFFWALLLYMILGAVTSVIVQQEQRSHQPRTPPGWHHHHRGDTQVEILQNPPA